VTSRIDPKTRVRKLHQVDLWEISIVTFPLLADARVHAGKAASSRQKLSPARTRAEVAWGAMGTGAPPGVLCSRPAVKSAARSHDAQRAFGVRPDAGGRSPRIGARPMNSINETWEAQQRSYS
jgi:hypothetical protein